jgi:hypothetical protein
VWAPRTECEIGPAILVGPAATAATPVGDKLVITERELETMREFPEPERTPKLVYFVASFGLACAAFAFSFSHWHTIAAFFHK